VGRRGGAPLVLLLLPLQPTLPLTSSTQSRLQDPFPSRRACWFDGCRGLSLAAAGARQEAV
jgi:hypothetical protein